MSLDSVKKRTKEIVDDGILNGFTIEHYKKLISTLNKIDSIEWAKNEEVYHVYSKIKYVIDSLQKYGISHFISSDNLHYIKDNAALLPLVLANNDYDGRIKMYSDNSYMFLCQFHVERTPSLGVTDIKNLYHCYGCGAGGSVFDYLQAYENLTFKEVVNLLAQIYLYDIKYDSGLSELARKYQSAITSDLYIDLLKIGQKRMESRNLGNNKYYHDKYEMIERIKKQEHDPNFEYVEPAKRIYLEIGNNGYIYKKANR